ncbi:hypothetical protein AGDE_00759 [Angomonas deanei]|uniref:Methyltransferase domain containing protein n=1 Tax=Angomonas deanei TaxID=59799 RepID=A0A7G2CQM6_9TRYP|nr:hypothetical protein AGDE_00759 [Angomonas deanei]CAD2220803.1 hypothetical protein, conserved [Angomonas deanei]|eukprot:EPY43163.1 hypothetical protein AGDE_00759 [Angomonas deanei]
MELPFQWDDGNFISPFVRSTEEDMRLLVQHLYDTVWGPQILKSNHGSTFRLRMVDLGCGDGAALLFLYQSLTQLWKAQHSTDGKVLVVEVCGIDLDEELVEQACASAQETPESTAVKVSFVFRTEDVRYCSLDQYFPKFEATAGDGTDVVLQPLLFLYLLPEALEALEKYISEIMNDRHHIVVSNRWTIPYFPETQLTVLEHHIHVYRHT